MPGRLDDQFAEMIDRLQSRDEEAEEVEEMVTRPADDEEVKEAPVEEEVVAEDEEGEEEEVEEVVVEEEGEESVEEEEDEEEVDESEELIAQLRQQVNDLSKEIQRMQNQQPKQGEEEEDSRPAVVSLIENEDEFEAAFASRDKMNELLNKTIEQATEKSQRAMTPQMQSYVDQRIAVNNLVRDFFDANEHLKPHYDYVWHLAQKLDGENPDKPLTEVFDMARERAESELGLNRNGKSKSKTKEVSDKEEVTEKPAFAGSKGNGRGSSGGTNLGDQEKQMQELLSRRGG